MCVCVCVCVKLKTPFFNGDPDVNLPGLGCVFVSNRLINGLGIYPFTYMIQIYIYIYICLNLSISIRNLEISIILILSTKFRYNYIDIEFKSFWSKGNDCHSTRLSQSDFGKLWIFAAYKSALPCGNSESRGYVLMNVVKKKNG